MDSLFLKDERLEASPAFVGYYIMKAIRAGGRSEKSLLDIANELGKQPWYSPRHLHLGLLFLFSLGVIAFEAPYVRSNVCIRCGGITFKFRSVRARMAAESGTEGGHLCLVTLISTGTYGQAATSGSR